MRFAAGGWPVTLMSPAAFQSAYPVEAGDGYGGFHDETAAGPSAVVDWDPTNLDAVNTSDLSHEVIEMLVDPSGTGREVCDPVANYFGAQLDGVTVADFVTPAWFHPGWRGPWDAATITRRAGDLAWSQ